MFSVPVGTSTNKICDSKECLRTAADFLQTMDRSINPCDDFYKFSCGNWEEEHPRPDSSTSFDWFSEKQQKIIRKIREFLRSNISEVTDPIPIQQAKLMYTACMDTDKLDELKLSPVIKVLRDLNLPDYPKILNITSSDYSDYHFDWLTSLVKIKQSFGADLIIGFDIFPDPTNQTVNRVAIGTPEGDSPLPL